MSIVRPVWLVLGLVSLPFPSFAAALSSLEAEQVFARFVQPMMQDKCLACHGRDENKIKGGLDLRTPASALTGGDSLEPAFVPGKPETSPLYLAVTRTHLDWEAMPPKDNDALTAEQQAYLADWIAAGAPWPDETRVNELLAKADKWSTANGVPVKTSGGLAEDWTQRLYSPENLWAYRPLRKPEVPRTSSPNPIDAFIGAKLAATGLVAAPTADRRTLIRRATFDLTGLPPTPEDVTAFISDPASDDAAFDRVVERLLASPHYGEQWGRHWLDIVRYADSSGLANDYTRGNTWRYRDYVVRAFNTDKPYADFVREQIAGDEIAAGNPEPLVAAGFLRMGPWELTKMEVPKVARQKFLDDVTDSVGQVFLAHPLQCARCHDHKFDPIPTKDYYSFQAIFATTQLAERSADFLPTENTTGFEEKQYLDRRKEHYQTISKKLNAKTIAAARNWLTEQKIDPTEFENALLELSQNNDHKELVYEAARTNLLKRGVPEDRIPPRKIGFSVEDYGLDGVASKGLGRLAWSFDRYKPIAFTVYNGRTPSVDSVTLPHDVPTEPDPQSELEETAILAGGDPFSPTAKVTPAVLSAATFLGDMGVDPAALPTSIEGRRAALAEWIVSPKNPLTARVIANRIWLWHFGSALAGNPNNFGATGKKPTHPELLDWLAATFLEQGGSIKALHRLIMNSAAYRRASTHSDPKTLAELDPLGVNYAVFKPRRLAAEEIRDAMLAASGELNPALGGIPIRPEINQEAALQPRQVMGTFAEAWQPSPLPAQRNRRSIYIERIRGLTDPFMEVFNAPSPDLSCEARDASTVTPQVFALFNSEATLDRALALANRAQSETATAETTLQRLFELTLNRPPTPNELAATRTHWDELTARHQTLTFSERKPPREVLRDAVDENTGESFSFKEPLEVYDDFVPDLKLSAAPAKTRALADVCLVLLNTNEFVYVY